MKFKLRAMDADAQGQQKQMHHTQSSSSSSAYSYFTEQAIRGFPMRNIGGGHVPEMLRGRLETRESIQREIEKEKIRQEILAEEMERKRILEAEVRHELMMEREMMDKRTAGDGNDQLKYGISHSSLFEHRFMHRKPIGLDERIIMSLQQQSVHGGHPRDIRAKEPDTFQRFTDSPKIQGIRMPLPEDRQKQLVILGKPKGETSMSGTKRKSTPPVTEEGSSEANSDSSKKKVQEEWSCAICQISTTSERGLNEHLQGKKHQIKESALIAQKTGTNVGLGVAPKKPDDKPIKLAVTTVNLTTSEKKPTTKKESGNRKPDTNKTSRKSDENDVKKEDEMKGEKTKDEYMFWCETCQVGTYSEIVMNHHSKGKRHLSNLIAFFQKGEVNTDEKTETETKKAVVVEMVKCVKQDVIANEPDTLVKEVKAEVKTVIDDMEDASVWSVLYSRCCEDEY